jgi:dienelactone hydrolase
MAEVILFHHVQGLTDGLRAFAGEIRADGHTVHTPDLFNGELPASIEGGIALTDSIDSDELEKRIRGALSDVSEDVVYGGFSFGAATAQRLAQTRPGARGALLYESCLPLSGDWAIGPWPDGVPVQIHGMDNDPFFAKEGDLDAAREVVQTLGPDLAELFLYSGDQHLFADSSLASYDAAAAGQLIDRTREFLKRVDG